jgi:putative peptidoglycan binding protein
MWRFGIAAILLLVLVVAVAEMFFGGQASVFDVSLRLPSDGHSGRSVATDDTARFLASGESANDWTADSSSSPTRDPIDLPERSYAGHRSDGLRVGGDLLSSLSTTTDAYCEPHWPAYPPAHREELQPIPVARPFDVPPSARDRSSDPGHEASGMSDAARISRGLMQPNSEATKHRIAEAQKRLAALGYDPGRPDGRVGPRTKAAVRRFERDTRMRSSGRIDDRLLARLESEINSRTQSRRQERDPVAVPPPTAATPAERGIVGSVLGGLQRLLGRDFNSVDRPAELAAYCHANAETWIYDFGREAFVYCGNVNAGQVAVEAANPAQGASATR